jgi:hypothetical protein
MVFTAHTQTPSNLRPNEKHGLPSQRLFSGNSHECPTAQDLSYRISPKSDSDCGQYGQKFIYARKCDFLHTHFHTTQCQLDILYITALPLFMKIRLLSHRYQVKDAHRYFPHKEFFLCLVKNAVYSTCMWFARKITCSVCCQHIAGHTAEPTAEPSHHATQNLTPSRPITWSMATWQHRDPGNRASSPLGGSSLRFQSGASSGTNQPGRQSVHPCPYSVEVYNSRSYTPFAHTSSLNILPTNETSCSDMQISGFHGEYLCSLAACDAVYI